MSDDKTNAPFPLEGVEKLSLDELERRSDAVIAHMEETRPEIWFIFLYETGLVKVLAQFLAESPFKNISPITLAMRREIGRLNPDLPPSASRQIFRAVQQKITVELISKHLEFDPPK
jgi:hypothetical protein